MSENFDNNHIGQYFRANSIDMKYNVDIVFVVDATASMYHFMKTVKKIIPEFYKATIEALDSKNKHIDVLRVKMIFFRDFLQYKVDRYAPLMETDFYTLSDQSNDQSNELSISIASIEAQGGGDVPEDGLEALARAMQSKWCKPHDNHKRRHIIVVFTDASTHELGYGKDSDLYPPSMPQSFDKLTYMWGNQTIRDDTMEYQSKRLILFAPEMDKLPPDDGWRRIVKGKVDSNGKVVEKPWENLDIIQINPSNEFKDIDFHRILDRIVNSV